jgi:hypothetical protein
VVIVATRAVFYSAIIDARRAILSPIWPLVSFTKATRQRGTSSFIYLILSNK